MPLLAADPVIVLPEPIGDPPSEAEQLRRWQWRSFDCQSSLLRNQPILSDKR